MTIIIIVLIASSFGTSLLVVDCLIFIGECVTRKTWILTILRVLPLLRPPTVNIAQEKEPENQSKENVTSVPKK